MASLFCTPDRYDKTKVLLLDDGTTYFNVKIIPVASAKEVNNTRNHENGINALVSNINIESDTRTQFIPTLGTDIYAYTFGENLDNISIGGLGFLPCGSDENGFTQLVDFWSKNNVGKHGRACILYIGDNVYKAYLIQAEIGITEQLLGVFPFKFTFASLQFI